MNKELFIDVFVAARIGEKSKGLDLLSATDKSVIEDEIDKAKGRASFYWNIYLNHKPATPKQKQKTPKKDKRPMTEIEAEILSVAVDSLDLFGDWHQNFIKDLASKTPGYWITENQAKQIKEIAEKLEP